MVGENTSYSTTSTQKRGQTRKQTGRVSIRQDLPTTCRHPPAPQDSPSHPTQREEEVKRGEKERKRKTGHRCEACRTQPHGRDEETIERRYSDGGDWLWCKWTRLEGQIPPPTHRCVSHKPSETGVSARVSTKKNVISIPLIWVEGINSYQSFCHILVHAVKVECSNRAEARMGK